MIKIAGEAKTTTDHEEIKDWATKRGGVPSVVKGTVDRPEGIGMLRINFPGYGGSQSLSEISWEDFFKTFDERGLAFLYQDKLKDGSESRFFKFIKRR